MHNVTQKSRKPQKFFSPAAKGWGAHGKHRKHRKRCGCGEFPPDAACLGMVCRARGKRGKRWAAEFPPRQGTICRKRRTMVARLGREEGSRAGRSTAGLGGGGTVRQLAHAVSVRARFALFCETRRQILTIHKNNCKIETHILLIDSPIRNFGKHLTNAVLCCIFADKKSSTSKRN